MCRERTLGGEVEERGLLSAVGQLDVGVTQLIKEGVSAGLQRGEARRGRVLQQARAEGDGLRRGPRPEDLNSGRRQHQRVKTGRYRHAGRRLDS